jgi:AcrR family transcriptional regulator
MANKKRPYRKRLRADSEAATRLRITESTVELHGTVGPSRTSISAVAQRAGVRRSTVYRHFPDEASLFEACSAHWMGLNPPPDLAAWAALSDPDERLKTALIEIYGYYSDTHQMLENLYRDEDTVPTVKRLFRDFRDYSAAARDTLIAGRRTPRAARDITAAAVGHALAFPTWRSLTADQRLGNPEAAALMCALVSVAEQSSGKPSLVAGSSKPRSRDGARRSRERPA